MDLLNGSILGLHGILFVLITYICQRFFYQFRVSPIWQQSVILFFLFFIFKMAFSFDFFSSSLGFHVSDSSYITNTFIFAITSSLFWAPTFFTLRELRRRKVKLWVWNEKSTYSFIMDSFNFFGFIDMYFICLNPKKV